ncbi:TPA: hypothetical protein DDZ75_00185 [Patescibacteria group bacterium]|nr:hypothetical protein [Patescibacteria group bacterium]
MALGRLRRFKNWCPSCKRSAAKAGPGQIGVGEEGSSPWRKAGRSPSENRGFPSGPHPAVLNAVKNAERWVRFTTQLSLSSFCFLKNATMFL